MAAYDADTVIRRANVITIDPREPRATAVAMRNGRFIGVGSASDIEMIVGPDTKNIELPGKTVLPGFIAGVTTLLVGLQFVIGDARVVHAGQSGPVQHVADYLEAFPSGFSRFYRQLVFADVVYGALVNHPIQAAGIGVAAQSSARRVR